MSDRPTLEAERDALIRKLSARDGQPAYAESVVMILARLAEIEVELEALPE